MEAYASELALCDRDIRASLNYPSSRGEDRRSLRKLIDRALYYVGELERLERALIDIKALEAEVLRL